MSKFAWDAVFGYGPRVGNNPRHGKMRLMALAVLAAVFLIAPANAKPSEFLRTNATDSSYSLAIAQKRPVVRYVKIRRHRHIKRLKRFVAPRAVAQSAESIVRLANDAFEAVSEPIRHVAAVILGGRPSGCPHRFCGCALSIKVFGKSVRELWLASNWFRFPHVSPSSGMVAVRRGHVFQLMSHIGGSSWQVWDANSGRGRIRIHTRSIAGYSIVNPHGTRVARL